MSDAKDAVKYLLASMDPDEVAELLGDLTGETTQQPTKPTWTKPDTKAAEAELENAQSEATSLQARLAKKQHYQVSPAERQEMDRANERVRTALNALGGMQNQTAPTGRAAEEIQTELASVQKEIASLRKMPSYRTDVNTRLRQLTEKNLALLREAGMAE